MSAGVAPGTHAPARPAAGLSRAGGVVLVAHGSRDPAAAATTRALARGVAASCPDVPVRVAFLDHCRPRPEEAVAALADEGRPSVVVPLLLTAAYHGRVDLPAALARVELARPVLAEVLGPAGGVVPAPLLAALRRRLQEAVTPVGGCASYGGSRPYDAVVLAAAGTRHGAARATVELVARRLSEVLAVPCQVGYASAAVPAPGEAVAMLAAAGARQVVVASYFLATGQLYRAAAGSARAAGAVAVAAPLGAGPEVTALVRSRARAAWPGLPGAYAPG